jgi:CheY-like chemotaxis protein
VQDAVLRILVVEDDVLVQDTIHEALTEGGFQTEITPSGEEAIAHLQRDNAKFRALLTDIHLKGALTGWDVAKRAREINPQIPVVYMTGAAADQWPSHGVPNSVLLNKPFAPAQVVTAVSQLLNQLPPHE